MKQSSNLTRKLTAAQESHLVTSVYPPAILFTLYTEDKDNLLTLVSRYFKSATLINAVGLYNGQTELAKVIEIIGTLDDLQSVVHLAGDIKEVNKQESVLFTYAPVNSFVV